MGRILQRTSISTNIKERLDFSCALFDHTGGLVSNAPHIPGTNSLNVFIRPMADIFVFPGIRFQHLPGIRRMFLSFQSF
jgi:5-oxoprolinase (ATP-hydrolysing)